jgi:cellulose synthase/poly-beta-1,6-N-acetylglucosamine synthase-like glycosyltransferase
LLHLDQPAWWFLIGATLVAYTYLLYPLGVALLGSLGRQPVFGNRPPASVSIVMAAHNEGATIEGKVQQLTVALDRACLPGEIIVVSDGSTDGTAVRARGVQDSRIRVIERSQQSGKAAALNDGCAAATGEVLVFADVRQHWPADSVVRLLQPFADSRIGAASGKLHLANDSGELAGVGLYWRFETWLRHNESRLYSTVGVSGSIAAVRRPLFPGIPAGTILDDVYWPLQVVMQGYRVVHVDDAVAYDRLPPRRNEEFRRKVRTLSGNFQLLTRLPQALLPWRNPICLQFISHKLLRLAVPWALLVMLVASALSLVPWLRTLLWLQLAFYGLGIAGLLAGNGRLAARLSPITSFILLNAAAWAAFWVWISGRASGSWAKIGYQSQSGPR